MKIQIKYLDDEKKYNINSFDEINNNIIYLDCNSNNLNSLPDHLNLLNLQNFSCDNNNLTSLPENISEILPNLQYLNCSNNNLTILPDDMSLLNLQKLDCYYNNLTLLPEHLNLPNLQELNCSYNNLTLLPELPNSLNYFDCDNNPIDDHIKKKLNNNWREYRVFQQKIKQHIQRVFANKIGNWFLECKYNPRYEYCRKRLKLEYDSIYNT